jgi:polyisoprenyl-teichoic acid--peptidoglycan teichoic acid transferase
MIRRLLSLCIIISWFAAGLAGCQNAATQAPPTAPSTAVVVQPTASPTPTTAIATPATPIASPTPGPSPTVPPPPTFTPLPTNTAVPTATPTSQPQINPVLQITAPVVPEGVSTPATAIPTAVPTFEAPPGITNVLLLGNDFPLREGDVQRTDTMIIVSINRNGPTASMISLPRDLYVYIPGGNMQRLNTAVTLGGVELLKQTILYNFGIPINYYARVDFAGFEQIVDAIGGVEITVTCRFEDWRLKSPELDIEDPDNWELQALEPGVHQLDGDAALWYARSRLRSSDFDRNRRQQQLLRAMFNQGVDLNLIPRVPELWNTFQDTVETDMDIGRILQIASLAPAIRENGVQNLYLVGKMQPWTVPEVNQQVQLPIWEGPNMMRETFQRLFLPPALNKATRAPIRVEVINASSNPDLARLAADNLAWYGFVPIINPEPASSGSPTSLSYYAPNFKGSYDWLISWILHMDRSGIALVEDETDYAYNYRAVVGDDYDPCLNPFFAPQSLIP